MCQDFSPDDISGFLVGSYSSSIFTLQIEGRRRIMKVPSTALKLRVKLNFHLKEGSSHFTMHKLCSIVPKVTVLTEYAMDFLRIYK